MSGISCRVEPYVRECNSLSLNLAHLLIIVVFITTCTQYFACSQLAKTYANSTRKTPRVIFRVNRKSPEQHCYRPDIFIADPVYLLETLGV